MIDDDRKLCRLVATYLQPLGFDVTAVHTGPEGVERASTSVDPWHAIILDVMLPGIDGFEVLKRIRARSLVPVLMLTARGDETDRIVGLEVGADDYLPKTFSTRELLARLRAVLRRSAVAAKPANGEVPPTELVVGPLRINLDARSAVLDTTLLVLTPVEFDLLSSLARARGRVKSREALLDEIRDRNYDVFDRSIDVHISSLRKKLGDDAKEPRYIRTVRSAGYMMVGPE
jgi:DNA-binding response OmpR family regulator